MPRRTAFIALSSVSTVSPSRIKAPIIIRRVVKLRDKLSWYKAPHVGNDTGQESAPNKCVERGECQFEDDFSIV